MRGQPRGRWPQYIVEDFLNADPAFDVFVGHARTLDFVREMVESPLKIAGSELRYRYRGNITGSHMGGPIDPRNRYTFIGALTPQERPDDVRHFDLLLVRVLYALHDLPVENGPLCVVPGSHKSNYHSPYGMDPMQEPGMVPLPMAAGDALFFTENLRHGGYPNVTDRVRKTVHLCFSPAWVGSRSPAHWDGGVFVTPKPGRATAKRNAGSCRGRWSMVRDIPSSARSLPWRARPSGSRQGSRNWKGGCPGPASGESSMPFAGWWSTADAIIGARPAAMPATIAWIRNFGTAARS
jgi:hypothetical protein